MACELGACGTIDSADEVSFPSVGLIGDRALDAVWFAGGIWCPGFSLSTTVARKPGEEP